MPEDDVIRLAVQCAEAGVDEVGLSDTTGMANPARCAARSPDCAASWPRAGARPTCTTHAAWAWPTAWPPTTWVCARSTPSCKAGWRLPLAAPGASGNVVTDLVFMFSHGHRRRRDYNLLMAAREALQVGLPDEPLCTA